MTTTELLPFLRALRQNTHPVSGQTYGAASCLEVGEIQQGLDGLIALLKQDVCPEDVPTLTAAEVAELSRQLRDLGYAPTDEQLARVLTGSRSIADARLRGLPAYRRYRGRLSRRELKKQLTALAEASGDDWRQVDFFDTGAFDKLSEAKAAELGREVAALGMRKNTERLPAYMRRARERLPRSFEPWTRAERALLVEAMCYTNDAERLAAIFGRSAAAIVREGKRLIWKSRAQGQ